MSFTLWFTGIPRSGKTTLSHKLFLELMSRGLKVELLDGDIFRSNTPWKLGFSKQDREINVLLLGFISQLLNRNGVISIVGAIAPYKEHRRINRQQIDRYLEAYCQCCLEIAEGRDRNGLYARARAGEISHFTGISDPYEEPKSPEILVRTDLETIEESIDNIIKYLESKNYIPILDSGLLPDN